MREVDKLVTAFLSMDDRRQQEVIALIERIAQAFPRMPPPAPPTAS